MDDELLEIDIPCEFLDLCSGWAGDTDCMLRAIDSTGDLTLGSIRPHNDETGEPMTDREWHHHLWGCLEIDVMHCRMAAERNNHEDTRALRDFEDFAEATATELATAYGLET